MIDTTNVLFTRAFFLPRDGVWTEDGENHYADSNYKYHPVLNAILNSVTVTACTAKQVSFNITIRNRTYSLDVHCTPSGKAHVDLCGSTLCVRFRRVVKTCVNLKVGTSLEKFEAFLMDAAENAVARRKEHRKLAA